MLDTELLSRPQLIHSNWGRQLFWRSVRLFLLLVGLATIWLAPHPPMIDVPQHAGQIALLTDLIRGESAWSDLVWTNLWTPYLLGYALLLPLAQIFSISTAIKLLLSATYVCFVFECFLLRRKFRADEGLDIYAAVGFFGFAYYWGFLTFVVAAPLVLAFVLLSMSLTEKPSLGRASAVSILGLLLLISHGLAFAFAVSIGSALYAWRRVSTRVSLWPAGPYVALTICAITYVWWSRSVEEAQGTRWSLGFKPEWDFARLSRISLSPFTGDLDGGGGLNFSYAVCMAIFLLAPWIMGLRIGRMREALIPLSITLLVLLFIPSHAASAAFLYQRFGLFLLPAYAWAFKAPRVPGSSLTTTKRYSFGQLVIVAASAWVLGIHAVQSWNFGRETREIDSVIDKMDEGQRALMLVFDSASTGARMRWVYVHYAAWYQAERKGFVDFNFAWFPPLIVRFRPGLVPPVEPGLEWHPVDFNWVRHHGTNYKYFFVRGRFPENIFAEAECPPVPIWHVDGWTVFERKPCR